MYELILTYKTINLNFLCNFFPNIDFTSMIKILKLQITQRL